MTRVPFTLTVRVATAIAIASTLLACGDGSTTSSAVAGDAADTGAATTAPRSASTLPIPGATPAPPQAGRHDGLLRWDAPDGWTAVPPPSSMRLAQYDVPGPDGTAVCIVYYFGPGQGGDPMANAMRWAGQFIQPDGGDSRERMQVEPIDGTRYPTRLVSVTGTYNGGMTMTDQPSPEQPGAMLLGGIVEGPDAPWFFKLTGPEATVAAARDELVGLLRSLRPAGG